MPAYAIGLELTILLAFWLCLGVLQRDRGTPGRTTFVGLAAAAILWCLGELLNQHGALPELWADRIRYVGVLALPPFWIGLAAHATRRELARRVPWFHLVLLAPLLVPYALLYSGTWSGLFMRTIEGGTDAYGPVWWVTAIYGYALVIGGCAMYLDEAWRARRRGSWLRNLARRSLLM